MIISLKRKEEQYIVESKNYLSKLELEFVLIPSDDWEFGYEFCTSTHIELIDNYGSDKFKLTVNFFEDYFEMISVERDNKLNKILK